MTMPADDVPDLLPDTEIDIDRESDRRYGRGRRGRRDYYDDVYDADGSLLEPIPIWED